MSKPKHTDACLMHNAQLLAMLGSHRPDGVVSVFVGVPSNEHLLWMDPDNDALRATLRKTVPVGWAYVHGHDVYASAAAAATHEFKAGTRVMNVKMVETDGGDRRFHCHRVHPPPPPTTTGETDPSSTARHGDNDDKDEESTDESETDA